MAGSNRAQHGASARTGRARTTRTTSATRAPAKRSRTQGPKKTPSRARSRVRALPWRYLPVAIVAVVAILGWTLYPVVRLSYRQSRERVKLEQQLADIEKRNEVLKHEVARLKTPAGVEDAARDRLGFVKKGEHMYIVMPSGGATGSHTPTAGTVQTADVSGDEGFVRRALDAVFGVGP